MLTFAGRSRIKMAAVPAGLHGMLKATFRPNRTEIGRVGSRRTFVVTGRERAPLRDLYHLTLIMPWPAFLGVMALGYLAANAGFALLYMLDPDGIANARPGSFWDAFFFSVQTIGTLGYGVMAPKSFYANLLVTAETFFGLCNLAIATGLIFARFSLPTARVMFSRVAVITEFDGVPTLTFRAANQRRNQILEAEVSVSFVHQTVNREGEPIRRFEELKMARAKSPVFALSWTLMHPIDETSPLRGMTRDMLADVETEIVVILSGIDETVSQRIHSRHSYTAEDIFWDHRFADIILSKDGQRHVDYGRFHDVEPIAKVG
jgi:inward rectifier potassium channel